LTLERICSLVLSLMAAVMQPCPFEFWAEGPGMYEHLAPPQPALRRATTEPAPIGLPPPPLELVSEVTPPPPPIDRSTDWAICQKNTFVSVQAPEQPPLFRSRTDPMHVSISDMELSGTMGPPPPPLALEFVETEDFFGPVPMAGYGQEDMSAPPGLPSPARLSMRAPPPLSFEYVETDDPFQPTPSVADGLPMPPFLSLEYVDTDDPFRVTPTQGWLAPPPLTFEYTATDDPLWQTPETSALLGPPGLPAPPPLALETFDTEDPLEQPFQPSPFLFASEPAFVNLQPMLQKSRSLPSRTALCGPPPPPVAPAPLIGSPMTVPPPPPPSQMPSMPAPQMEAPSAHDVPMAQPGHTPGAGIATLLTTELRQPGVLVRPSTATGCTHVHWAVDSRKLDGQDKQAVSQVFLVELPGQGPTPFKLVLYPRATNDGKHGAGFKKAKGRGRVVLKCEAQITEGFSDVSFRVGVGRADKGSETLQALRGPVTHNFSEHSCHGLAKSEEEWDFTASVEDRTFLVTVEIAPTAAFEADPSIWWAPLPPPSLPTATAPAELAP